jgi:hypothetical protein
VYESKIALGYDSIWEKFRELISLLPQFRSRNGVFSYSIWLGYVRRIKQVPYTAREYLNTL